jgi:ketosteroid isomerase-like protein
MLAGGGGTAMTKQEIETLLRAAYDARRRGDVAGILELFTDDVEFAMAGAREASPVALRCTDGQAFRAALTGLVQTFEWLDQAILAMVIEGDRAAVHWRGKIRSAATGEVAETELVDLVTVRDGKIASFLEFCDTALAAKLMRPQAAAAA